MNSTQQTNKQKGWINTCFISLCLLRFGWSTIKPGRGAHHVRGLVATAFPPVVFWCRWLFCFQSQPQFVEDVFRYDLWRSLLTWWNPTSTQLLQTYQGFEAMHSKRTLQSQGLSSALISDRCRFSGSAQILSYTDFKSLLLKCDTFEKETWWNTMKYVRIVGGKPPLKKCSDYMMLVHWRVDGKS